MYAVIRIRGTVNIAPKIATALEHLNLRRVNNLSIWQETPQTLQMIKIVMDYVAFGTISEETLKKLIEAKGESVDHKTKIDAKKVVAEIKSGKTLNQVGIDNCFRMSPPRKGYERKGIKTPYVLGGASGNRKEAISELIERML